MDVPGETAGNAGDAGLSPLRHASLKERVMSKSLRTFAFAAGLSLAAAGVVLAPTSAMAWPHGGHHGGGHHGGGHWGGHGGFGHHGGHWGGGHWGYGPRFVYGGGCYLKRYVNSWGELVVRRVCW
jgi:uncharacterized membrane protein